MRNTRYRAYAEYEDSGNEWLGALPTKWKVGRLKHNVDESRPITYGIVQAGPHIEDGVPYIRPADMSDEKGVVDFDGLPRTSPLIAADYERSKIRSGDIICSIGPSFGKVMIAPDQLDGANLTQGTARVAICTKGTARYFFWVLRSTSSFQQWESSVGGATFRALNLGPLAETAVPLPSLAEQTQIAKFLDHETAKIDRLIEKQQTLIALLKEKRQAVISHAVTKGLNPDAPMKDSGILWLGRVPAHWKVGRYKFCTTRVVVGIAEAATHAYAESGTPIIRSTNISDEGLSEDGILYIKPWFAEQNGSKYLYAGDIVTVRTGYPGISATVPKSLDRSQCFTNLVATPSKDAVSEFLTSFLNSHFGKEYFELTGWGSAQKNISVPILQNIPVVWPPLDEQRKIVEFVRNQRSEYALLISAAENAISLLQERRTALISAAVTGKIDVRDWQPPRDA